VVRESQKKNDGERGRGQWIFFLEIVMNGNFFFDVRAIYYWYLHRDQTKKGTCANQNR
jgi:hypothetical protein